MNIPQEEEATMKGNTSFGVCLGASTVSIAERCGNEIQYSRIRHDGKVAAVFQEFLAGALPATIGVTGRKFRNLLTMPTVPEPEAVELAYGHIRPSLPDIDCIVSAGGETFLVYVLDRKGRIRTVHTGNKCASGTGEFFMQQLQRMELPLGEAVELATAAEPYQVAGRCSVFCKSDCTHALNKGAGKGEVAAGLCRMMAGKIVELLKKAGARRIALVGGVSSNPLVLDFIRESYPETYVPAGADCFEALGALLWGEREGVTVAAGESPVRSAYGSFPALPDLAAGLGKVSFHSAPRGEFSAGEHILGLDVGSTTTKIVLMRRDTLAITASAYLRTNGDPIGASRECYREILAQLPPDLQPAVVGLGVTGSGRQIAGLHALTRGVINEIVAHAAAAVHFDPEVETIFEIGGQDAKYTSITNRVASDYAMNEACSAGTGSFLEEACRESLGIDTGEIAGIAFDAEAPPDFNDQCAAFIGSDIKTAVQEGVGRAEIVAGLVYSVCQNYLNRVKGNRPVGRKIFMQGGVCYNRAVPVAMANLCGQEIIVPPEPGLMGAFGAALEIHRKLERGLLAKERFALAELAGREVSYGAPFTCAGGRDGCDRKCTIARIVIDGKNYPFGGACDLYYNLRQAGGEGDAGLDLVRIREELVFRTHAPVQSYSAGITVGIPASLFTNTFYPLYAHFFANLGVRTILGATPDPDGMDAAGAAFCHPVALGHGLVKGLLGREIDWLFLPHVKNSALDRGDDENCTCPFVQGEPYYLKAAFHDLLAPRLLTAVLDFGDRRELRRTFAGIGRQLGFPRGTSGAAFDKAWEVLLAMLGEMREYGRRFLAGLNPDETALVLFGRSYNAFSGLGNMGIPHKFASRGYKIIPCDFLPLDEVGSEGLDRMYWTSGQGILRAARFILGHPNLFGVYITNFSCGPDSFITGYFRNAMGQRPSLTLELDAHTADAGIDTRIEAFLDVVRGYRELNLPDPPDDDFVPARIVINNGIPLVRTGDGRELLLTDPAVHVVIPSMGDTASRGLAAALRYQGVNADAVTPPGREELNLGKGEATCKECLPLLLTSGSLMKYLRERQDPDEVLVYFMPNTDGPCRFGQYNVFLDNYIRKNRVGNVAQFSLSFENGYAGMSTAFTRRAWLAITISDGLDDLYAGVLTVARDRAGALAAFDRARMRILESLATDRRARLLEVITEEMGALARFERKHPIGDAVRVNLAGEVYVRRDGFSRQSLVESLADRGVLVRTAPLGEWFHYSDYCVSHGLSTRATLGAKLSVMVKNLFMRRDEADIQRRLALSGFYEPYQVDMKYLMEKGAALISPELSGEAILTVSSTLAEVGDEAHGVISIGPFGCMPCRIAEAVLTCRLADEKANFSRHHAPFWEENKDELPLPFLAIESDGSAFPQVVEARIESLVLSARRLQGELRMNRAA
ncbi:MAG TPA: acyl-CoA dehydratase activase [Geobacteraceae bacterium]